MTYLSQGRVKHARCESVPDRDRKSDGFGSCDLGKVQRGRPSDEGGDMNPKLLENEFRKALSNEFGPATLAAALTQTIGAIKAARAMQANWQTLADILSRALKAEKREAVSAATLRGMCRRLEKAIQGQKTLGVTARKSPSPEIVEAGGAASRPGELTASSRSPSEGARLRFADADADLEVDRIARRRAKLRTLG
ncbi:hypothetical protein ABEG18_06295 [Alsobacter sp. KACC 23698]|uniref:Uncharacterized protein n=1 Tax=Alsobacter sp. KACC 23698 TaxID=3149229 RepID=A0AAU7JJ84_9HYPH